jgi:hypothetical protein
MPGRAVQGQKGNWREGKPEEMACRAVQGDRANVSRMKRPAGLYKEIEGM